MLFGERSDTALPHVFMKHTPPHTHKHTHIKAIIHSYKARNRYASLLRCLNTALIYELAVMCEVKYKDVDADGGSWWAGAMGRGWGAGWAGR